MERYGATFISHKCDKYWVIPLYTHNILFFLDFLTLHTQEVTGSSPAVSTKKFLISAEIRNFFAFMFSNSNAAFWRFSLDPKAERTGKHGRGADGIIRSSPAIFCGYIA